MTLGCSCACWPVGRKKGREGFFVGDLRLDEVHKEWNESRRFVLCDDLP